MKEYIHGWCSMDIRLAGVTEFHKGTEITCSHFRQMFLSLVNTQEQLNG
jgi:hypothetical protein